MNLKELNKKSIILASASPRRQELLKNLGILFTVDVKPIEENYNPKLKKEEITDYLALSKANAFEGCLTKNTILITADTIVWHNNAALEKPKDSLHAKKMLKKLSGTQHQVITSICIKTSEICKVISDTTTVFFKQITDNEIDFYVENYKPFDKAGAYGIQEWIGFIGVYKIEGSYFNVMGLPVHKLYEELMKM